jgi:1,4-alpha-glucan branching enzyme
MGNEFGHPEWIDLPARGQWLFVSVRPQAVVVARQSGPALLVFGQFDEASRRLVRGTRAIEGTVPRRFFVSDKEKILVFERGPLVFLFNFHSSASVCDYSVWCRPARTAGPKHRRWAFGGHDRIRPDKLSNCCRKCGQRALLRH